MKKIFKIFGYLIVFLIALLVVLAAWIKFTDLPTYEVKNVDITLPTDSASIYQGGRIVETMCAYCHRSEDGVLNGKLFSPESEGFGEIWSGNITRHPTFGLGRYKDGELAYLLRTGIKNDGKLAGPFMLFPNISDYDMACIIAYLRSDASSLTASDVERKSTRSFVLKALLKIGIFKPLPFDASPKFAPEPSDKVAVGKYISTALFDCSGCHSESFETHNVLEPEKTPGFMGGGNLILDRDFKKVKSRNITPHPEYGIGKWNIEQFKKALRDGIRPDGTSLSDVMPKLAILTDEEIESIWAYLQTVPPLETKKSELEN